MRECRAGQAFNISNGASQVTAAAASHVTRPSATRRMKTSVQRGVIVTTLAPAVVAVVS